MSTPSSNPPSYSNDVSPPLYTTGSEDEEWTHHIRSDGRVPTTTQNPYFWLSGRLRGYAPLDMEAGDPASSPEHDESSEPAMSEDGLASERYEYTDTGRGTYPLSVEPASSISSFSSASASAAERESSTVSTTGAQSNHTHQHAHTWASPPSHPPPDYYTSEMLAATAAATTIWGDTPGGMARSEAGQSRDARGEDGGLREVLTWDSFLRAVGSSGAPTLTSAAAPAHAEPHADGGEAPTRVEMLFCLVVVLVFAVVVGMGMAKE